MEAGDTKVQANIDVMPKALGKIFGGPVFDLLSLDVPEEAQAIGQATGP